MSDWKDYKLGDVSVLSTGYPFPGHLYEPLGHLRVVRGENVTIGSLRWDSEKYWNHSVEKLDSYFLQENDIVIGMDGSRVGQNRSKVRSSELPLILAQRVARIRAITGFDQDFIWYCIFNNRFCEFVNYIHTGTSIPHISLDQIAIYDIQAPSLSEQVAIAGVLSSLDDKIDLLHRQNKTLEGMAEALWRKMFIEDADVSWPIITIADVASINEKNIDRSYPYREIEYLDTGSITEGQIESFQTLSLDNAPSRARRIVQKDDIIISMVRPIQRHYGLLKNVKENTVVSTGFVVITCKNINPYFIYILITQNDMTEYLEMIAEGSMSTYPSLSPSDIEKIEFQMPPVDLLKKFNESASLIWDKIDKNYSQIQALCISRDSFLPKLMSGEVRVKI